MFSGGSRASAEFRPAFRSPHALEHLLLGHALFLENFQLSLRVLDFLKLTLVSFLLAFPWISVNSHDCNQFPIPCPQLRWSRQVSDIRYQHAILSPCLQDSSWRQQFDPLVSSHSLTTKSTCPCMISILFRNFHSSHFPSPVQVPRAESPG